MGRGNRSAGVVAGVVDDHDRGGRVDDHHGTGLDHDSAGEHDDRAGDHGAERESSTLTSARVLSPR